MNASIQRRLALRLSLAILVAAVVAGLLSFLSALEEAHELQDDMLRQVAHLVDPQRLPPPDMRVDDDTRLVVQRLGQPLPGHADHDELPVLPATLPDGLQTHRVGDDAFRVLVRTTATGERIAVSQETHQRDEIARDSALRAVTPLLILVPVLLLIAADLVRKMFRPIAALAREIDQRADEDLRPLDAAPLPREIRPFVVAINRLFTRVTRAMEAQRRFVADAAHELRSPLTALSLQAERLAGAEMSTEAGARLALLRQGIERGRQLIDQLLSLARAQAAPAAPAAPVSVQAVYRRVLEDLMPLAQAKQIDIGVDDPRDARLWASESDLVTLIKNLVDNAIRYTPEAGRIDLALERAPGQLVLRVQDSGPGIDPAERARVFDPFYRPPGSEPTGSGLGLAIVQTIASRLGAQLRLDWTDAAQRRGLCVRLLLPARLEAEATPLPGATSSAAARSVPPPTP